MRCCIKSSVHVIVDTNGIVEAAASAAARDSIGCRDNGPASAAPGHLGRSVLGDVGASASVCFCVKRIR
jgi:hypothetical protein